MNQFEVEIPRGSSKVIIRQDANGIISIGFRSKSSIDEDRLDLSSSFSNGEYLVFSDNTDNMYIGIFDKCIAGKCHFYAFSYVKADELIYQTGKTYLHTIKSARIASIGEQELMDKSLAKEGLEWSHSTKSLINIKEPSGAITDQVAEDSFTNKLTKLIENLRVSQVHNVHDEARCAKMLLARQYLKNEGLI